MKRNVAVQALTGIGLLVLGALCAYLPSRGYTQRHVVAETSSCRVDMILVQKRDAAPIGNSGAVVLFHGLAANKFIMTYLARSFAQLGLTVFVPDLPGHGQTAGPFTPQNAEACAGSLLRGLAARGLLPPDRTILAGHSMGAAIALRVAPQFRPAGVIAISPAPMKTAHGLSPEKLLFPNAPRILPNTLISAGQFEPQSLAANAADLVPENNADPTIRFVRLPGQSHVSVLFSPGVARMAQNWAGQVLHLTNSGSLPSRLFLVGGVLGFAGILVLAGPFLRELTTEVPKENPGDPLVPHPLRAFAEVFGVSLLAVSVLRYVAPLRVLGLFPVGRRWTDCLAPEIGTEEISGEARRAAVGGLCSFDPASSGDRLVGFDDYRILDEPAALGKASPLFLGRVSVPLCAGDHAWASCAATTAVRDRLVFDSAGLGLPGHRRVLPAQRADPGGGAGTVFCAVFRAVPAGYTIGTPAHGFRDRRRNLRCYTFSGFLPGALSGVLGATGQPASCPVPHARR
jgi:pimeloyl-ACP methyl ester carboxylesterase